MRVKVFWIDGLAPGRLGLMPRPRGGDWLEDEIRALKAEGVEVIASLLERGEIEELEILEEGPACEANGILFLSFPIRDRNVPQSKIETWDFVRTLALQLGEGKSVVVHCRQGVGRSALIAATVLASNGVPVDEAFRMIEEARGCPVPDTPEQREWVARFAEDS